MHYSTSTVMIPTCSNQFDPVFSESGRPACAESRQLHVTLILFRWIGWGEIMICLFPSAASALILLTRLLLGTPHKQLSGVRLRTRVHLQYFSSAPVSQRSPRRRPLHVPPRAKLMPRGPSDTIPPPSNPLNVALLVPASSSLFPIDCDGVRPQSNPRTQSQVYHHRLHSETIRCSRDQSPRGIRLPPCSVHVKPAFSRARPVFHHCPGGHHHASTRLLPSGHFCPIRMRVHIYSLSVVFPRPHHPRHLLHSPEASACLPQPSCQLSIFVHVSFAAYCTSDLSTLT